MQCIGFVFLIFFSFSVYIYGWEQTVHSWVFFLIFISLQDTAGFNTPLLRPRVIGEWIGREENDADPLAAEMLQPPIPRNKNEQWDSEDSSSPGGRWVFDQA